MSDNSDAPKNRRVDSPAGDGMNRREMVRRLATAMTAGTALAIAPGFAAGHPVYKHMMSESAMRHADEKAADPNWSPVFFDPHQNGTFIALAERIIPGSTGAQVNRFVDLLLSVDTIDAQKKFLNSFAAIESYSLKNYHQPFKELTEDEQNQVLTVASTAKSGIDLHRPDNRRVPEPGSRGALLVEGEHTTLRDHFENLKQWVSGAYFSSEPGMKSMGWTGQVMWPSFPGCQHPEGHA